MLNEVLVIIPARGGSKGIVRKNIKLLGGEPLIAYSIAAGLQSSKANRVVVSTDDEEIACVAERYGAQVPFQRPKELAEDHVTDLPVFQHALKWLEEKEGYRPDIVIQLRPTSPLRPKFLVDLAIDTLRRNPSADCVRAVTPSGEDPYKMWRIENGQMEALIHSNLFEPYNMPRQKLPKTYWQTGHVEAIRFETIVEKNSMTGDCILPVIIDHKFAIDIDNEEQWKLTEHYLSMHKKVNEIVLPD